MNADSQPERDQSAIDRREFVKLGLLAGVGAAFGASLTGCASPGRRVGPAPEQPFAAPPIDRVRVGFVGVGGMGTNHVHQFLKLDGIDHGDYPLSPEAAARGAASLVTSARSV